MRLRLRDLIPTYVRYLEPLTVVRLLKRVTEIAYASGQQAQTRRTAIFLAEFHQGLHAHTQTQKRLGSRRFTHRPLETAAREFAHAVTCSTLAREYHAFRGTHLRRIVRNQD